MSKKKILFFVSTDRYFLTHRLELAVAAIKKNFDIYLITTITSKKYLKKIKKNNINIFNLRLKRSNLNPFSEILVLLKIFMHVRKIKPDVMHNVALKPVIYGSILGKFMNTKTIINAVSGTGIVFSRKGIPNIILQLLIKSMLYISIKNSKVIVQNKNDKKFIKTLHRNQTEIIIQNGVGVNLKKYNTVNKKFSNNILLASRMLWSKGVGDYINAIKIIKKRRKDINFYLAGSPDIENPDHIKLKKIHQWEKEGIIKYLGWVEDMVSLWNKTNIFCLPSYYGEGMPKSLIEAMAAGVPSITTNTPGCNEVIINNLNGKLVPINSPECIAKNILFLIDNKKIYKDMVRNCRDLAVKKFNQNKIIAETLKLYE